MIKLFNGVFAGVLLLWFLLGSEVMAEVQTPAEIVKAEFDAGNFNSSTSSGDLHYRMRDVIVTGDKEVTYRYELPSFLSNRFEQIKGDTTDIYNNPLFNSLAGAIERSPQDRENLYGGITYKFSFMVVSDASREVLFSRATVVTVKIK